MLGRSFWGTASPWHDVARMRRDMNRMFRNMQPAFGNRVSSGYPSMNVWANEEGLVVTAELPGIDPEALDISVVDKTLTVTGNRPPESLEEGQVYHRHEREGYAHLARRFGLVPSGGSDFHGKYKPGLELGTGYGDLVVPESVVEELRGHIGST